MSFIRDSPPSIKKDWFATKVTNFILQTQQIFHSLSSNLNFYQTISFKVKFALVRILQLQKFVGLYQSCANIKISIGIEGQGTSRRTGTRVHKYHNFQYEYWYPP